MTSLHVICGLPPQSKILATPMDRAGVGCLTVACFLVSTDVRSYNRLPRHSYCFSLPEVHAYLSSLDNGMLCLGNGTLASEIISFSF